MLNRVLLALSALLLTSGALVGVGFSGATWTHTQPAPVSVAAASDWTPPTAVVSSLPVGVQGSAVQVSATASDERSTIASLAVEYAPAGSSTWTAFPGCTTSGTNPLTATCTWDTTLLPDGDYQVRARATDTAGYSTTSAVEPTSIVNNPGVVLDPFAGAVNAGVQLTTSLFNAGNSTAKFALEYSADGGATWTLICTDKNVTTLTCSWSTAALAEGSYLVRVRADSNSGHYEDSQAVLVDHTSPTASLSVPAGLLSGTVDLTASAGDAHSGVASVAFDYRLAGAGSWSTCGSDTSAPYSCSLNTFSLTNAASYDFRATATDLAGNTTSTATQTRTVDNTPATVSITSPLEGSAVDGMVTVQASGQSVRGVTGVRIDYRRLGGTFTSVCTDTTAPYSCAWDVSALTAGGYELRAVLSQTAGGDVASATRAVSVDHTAGTVVVTSPATGAVLTNQTSVTVSGTTSATTGVTSVALRAIPVSPSGATTSTPCSLGSGTFTCTWDTGAIVYGTYDLRAEMTQGNGVVVMSAGAVNITVDNVVASVALNLSPTASPAGYVKGTETLTATTSSNTGITSVRYDVSPAGANTWAAVCSPAATGTPYSCAWDTTSVANATYDLRAVMTLATGATVTSGTVTVSVANLTAADVQAGDQNGFVTTADTLTLTYSTRVDLTSIKAGWDGTSTAVSMTYKDAAVTGAGTGRDRVEFSGANLGTVTFGQDYVKNGTTNLLSGTMTAAVVSGRTVVTVTLAAMPNGASNKTADTSAASMVWTPSTAVTDFYLGGACAAGAVTESGTSDADL